MKVTAEIEIARPREIVWAAITDIEQWTSMVTGIIDVKILNRPEDGLVGLMWEETRFMFGKEATETLWVTDAVENEYYCSRAESHGSVYIIRFSLNDLGEKTMLSISFSGEPRTPFVRTVSFCMAPIIKSAVINALNKDLGDIKEKVEKRQQNI
jgi:uncharacterized protein YndB with AHSA1/START domain